MECQRDKNIIIKEADKGSAVIIMDRDHYKSLCLAVLENSTYYAKQEKYDSREILKNLINVLLNMEINLHLKKNHISCLSIPKPVISMDYQKYIKAKS
jgi:hypothetical protein